MKKKKDGGICYSPSDLINFVRNPFICWVERYNLNASRKKDADATNKYVCLLQAQGLAHEKKHLRELELKYQQRLAIVPSHGSFKVRHRQSKGYMSEGKEVIYQAALKTSDRQFEGYADFIFKEECISNSGDWFYEPRDTKLASKLKPYFIIQLCAYAEMLKEAQGVLPKRISVLLGKSNTPTFFMISNFFDFYKQVKRSFLESQISFDPQHPPEVMASDDFDKWSSYAEKLLKKQDHLSLVAGITRSQIKKLKAENIFTLYDLAHAKSSRIRKMPQETFNRLKQQASLQLKSFELEKPLYEVIQESKDSIGRGLALLPPQSANDVWIDMEAYPDIEEERVYLLGASYFDKPDNLKYKDIWSHDKDSEKISFQLFVDWIYERWEQDPSMHIYHYNSYETAKLKKLMGIHATREKEVDALLRNNVFIDLYRVVRQGLRIGLPSYSLKSIESLYRGEDRSSEVLSATDSIVAYAEWLEHKDNKYLEGIRYYNKVDCDSLVELCGFLRELQLLNGIEYFFNFESKVEKVEKREGIRYRAADLAKELENELGTKFKNASSSDRELVQTMSYLLGYHVREDKPDWWIFYERKKMSQEELLDDQDCLGGLRCDLSTLESSKQVECTFDPKQETKLKVGMRCLVLDADSTQERYLNVCGFDAEAGRITLKGSKISELKADSSGFIGLIPFNCYSKRSLIKGIYNIVQEWKDSAAIPPALDDFLRRKRPRILGSKEGNLIRESNDFEKEMFRCINNMDSTTLCIQDPPGSGKTTKAARVIVGLVREGKRVAVTSNSHKAIANLMDRIMESKDSAKDRFDAAKIQSDDSNFHVGNSSVVKVSKKKETFENESYRLVGGTAWAFSDESAKDKFDYLFVDEAGQVPMANVVAMAASASNIILIGDQMQLSQPGKGYHPGLSGESSLNYLLGGHQKVIKSDFGIFLDTTYRLHPEICTFIADTFYNGQLKHAEKTRNRHLVLKKGNLEKTSGVLFYPVNHEGNGQSSKEEVEAVKALVEKLRQGRLIDENIPEEREVSLNDILIVTPYNVQVNKIKRAIPGIRVGSVDKFQGQEAPIVILSMCTSDASESVRGIEFVLASNRLNVALSRAQVLAIVVGSPSLADTRCTTIEQMKQVNVFCKIINQAI